MNKKGFTMVNKLITGVIGIVVLFLLAAALIPEAQDAGDNLSGSGVPLGGLFSGDGVIFVIIMASIVVGVIALFKLKGGK